MAENKDENGSPFKDSNGIAFLMVECGIKLLESRWKNYLPLIEPSQVFCHHKYVFWDLTNFILAMLAPSFKSLTVFLILL